MPDHTLQPGEFGEEHNHSLSSLRDVLFEWISLIVPLYKAHLFNSLEQQSQVTLRGGRQRST